MCLLLSALGPQTREESPYLVAGRAAEETRNKGVISKEGFLCPDLGRRAPGKVEGDWLGKVTRFQRKFLTVTVNLDRKALDKRGKRGSIAKLWVCSS